MSTILAPFPFLFLSLEPFEGSLTLKLVTPGGGSLASLLCDLFSFQLAM